MVDISSAATAAVNRFGLGARPGDLDGLRDPRGWLVGQAESGSGGETELAALPTSLDYLHKEAQLLLARRTLRQAKPDRRAPRAAGGAVEGGAERVAGPATPDAGALVNALKPYRQALRRDLLAETAARYGLAARTPTPFTERLVHFWSNHFAVSLDKGQARFYAAPMEREAIRPHVNGRFLDMLTAVETHPAMLRYLDNVQSIGPDSRAGEIIQRRLALRGEQDKGKAGGLNENLAREILELHTVGVNGGYTQADVTEFARAITGWGVPLPRQLASGMQSGTAPTSPRGGRGGSARGFGALPNPDSAFVFRAAAHEPGARRVMGKRYAEAGFEQGRAILADLARHPATAKHLSLKLARHFVADQPPPALVDRMARSYLEHDTDLAAVYRTLVESDEAWGAEARKFKTPEDFLVSGLRAGRIDVGRDARPVLALLTTLGEPMFTPRSPAGFPDTASDWLAPDALWKRVQAAEALGARVATADLDPVALADSVLGVGLDAETRRAIARAESPQQGVATLFASPAFQWRV